MNIFSQPIKMMSLAISFTLMLGLTARADDTEVYIGSTSLASEVKPNLVFIIDTSGSMNTDVELTSGSYDPTTTYAGDCSADNIYWSTGDAPSCSTSNYFLASSNKCDASATALASGGSGFYITQAARYAAGRREDRWSSLSSSDHNDFVECQSDWGVHGETVAAAAVYPADENDGGPWTATEGNGINWDTSGSTYTFYSANYLNWREAPGVVTTKTRLQIVQEVFSDLMDSVSNINIAVMRFDRDAGDADATDGGYFIMPMQALTDANRAAYQAAVNATTASGSTPLAETLYESYLFYKGAAVDYGDSSEPGVNVAGVLDPDDTSKYNSPVDYQCQKNFVILLTDGEPTSDTDADSKIEALSGFGAVTGAASCSGNCLDELADYMYSKDCSDTLDDDQNVIIYTIGFATDQALLSNAATKGGGDYYTADDIAGLTDAFTSILTEIQAINTTFIAPAVSVNAFNRFNHRDELYYALFRPGLNPKWDGNVKRYRLDGNPPIIVDKNGNPAINDATGFFETSAVSYWTPATDGPNADGIDGDNVEYGGAASVIAIPRTIYTYTGAGVASNVDLTATDNILHEDTAAITKTLLGDAAMTDALRTEILQWTRAVDLFDDDTDLDVTDARRRLGDPLHSKPLLITYGGTDESPDMTLFAGTNEGHIHAIDTDDGTEVFSFVPQELLPNLALLFDDSSSTSHPYGLDGPLTAWINDVNNNGILYAGGGLEAGEHAYIYQGMRRGGKNYYALDVSDRSAPVLKWVIEGGTGTFSELAQSWSSATKGKIKLNGADKHVLLFGGGYDVDQDDNAIVTSDTEGRAIFMVDADTGAKIWQAGPSGTGGAGTDPDLLLSSMNYSIPSDLSVIDINTDGYIDRLYVGDMGGQIWRIDFDNDTNTGAGNLATGGVIATLGDNTAAGNRRFYYAPDISLSEDGSYLNIAIGSGYRAHPLDDAIHDAFFVLHDVNVYGPALDASDPPVPVYTAITLSDLYDTTANLIGEGTAAEIDSEKAALEAKDGFYILMNEADGSYVGEKVLAKSLTIESKVLFTTYKPVSDGTGACSPSQGSASVYYINIGDGTPVDDLNLDDDVTRSDRRKGLVRGGIPPEPSLIFHDNGPVVLIGTEKGPETDLATRPVKTHWHVE